MKTYSLDNVTIPMESVLGRCLSKGSFTILDIDEYLMM